MDNPLFSILIANYNNGIYFNDCYKSIINQTENNFHVVLIDDCSTDDSFTIISEIIGQDSRFALYRNTINLGYQKSLIRAIELSKAPIFARVDPDDAILPTAVEESLKAHEANPNAGLVYSNFLYCDSNLVPFAKSNGKQIHDLDETYYNFNCEISHFASFKRKYYNLTTGIDIFNKRAEDKDIYMKMCEVAPVVHLNKELYYYRIHKSNVSTNKNSIKASFWHWVALIKMAERRSVNIENIFNQYFVTKQEFNNILNDNKDLQNKINRRLYQIFRERIYWRIKLFLKKK
jgi:glycosyltransferase involved in cell wall biosynthesis